jgi:phage-related baseplate assembly protein
MQLLDLPAPNVIEVFAFETIKARKLARVIELMKTKGIEYVPSESDDLMTMIETDAYDEMFLHTRINNAAKAQLLAFAMKEDLDHLGTSRYGVERLKGSKPYSLFTCTLSATLAYDVTLPAGLKLTDTKGAFALLLADVKITAGQLSNTGYIELQSYVESSVIKTETIVTPLPYVATAIQNETFHDGADVEDDERYRDRIWLSRERKSTAGSDLTYKYFSKTADARVADVKIINDTAGTVKIYLLSNVTPHTADQVMIDRVDAELNKEEVRPLTDDVQVNSATIINGSIVADIVLYDLTYEANVRELIQSRIDANTMIFGKSLSIAKQYGLLESEQVKDVTIANQAAINASAHEVIRITTLTLNFTGAA